MSGTTIPTSCAGLPTGFTEFDKLTGGLRPGDLVIVAGRPSMGKTTLAVNMAEYAAVNPKTRAAVAIFSMEMPSEQVITRMLASIGGVPLNSLRSGKISDEDWVRITGATSQLSEAKIFVDETPALNPTELRARARRVKREHGLSLIVVDYLQLMQVPGTKENRATEIAEISRGLKALAKELQVPVIALSQLNRGVEQREHKRPVMSDLAGIRQFGTGCRHDPVDLSRRGLRQKHYKKRHCGDRSGQTPQRRDRYLPPHLPGPVHALRELRTRLVRGRCLAVSRLIRAVIDTQALRHNLNVLRARAGRAKVIAVVKANAYGHGLVSAALAIQDAGAFAVARLEEGMSLRAAGIGSRIVLLEGVFSRSQLEDAAHDDLDLVVHDARQIELLEQSAGRGAFRSGSRSIPA